MKKCNVHFWNSLNRLIDIKTEGDLYMYIYDRVEFDIPLFRLIVELFYD